MILAKLAALSLAAQIATGPIEAPAVNHQLTLQQKNAALRPLVDSATECIARSVIDRRAGGDATAVGELIVDSMPGCVVHVRAMIAAYDDYFGMGTGEAFFMGPYLDVLPRALISAGVPR